MNWLAIRALPWRYIAAAVGTIALLWAVVAHFDNDRDTRDALATLKDEAQTVVLAVQAASGNDDVEWQTAPGQIIALGESNRMLEGKVTAQNKAIDELAREAVRLKAKAAELKRIADKAQAQRKAALERLSDMAITPGTRSDCMMLLREAEAALDLVKEAGL